MFEAAKETITDLGAAAKKKIADLGASVKNVFKKDSKIRLSKIRKGVFNLNDRLKAILGNDRIYARSFLGNGKNKM